MRLSFAFVVVLGLGETALAASVPAPERLPLAERSLAGPIDADTSAARLAPSSGLVLAQNELSSKGDGGGGGGDGGAIEVELCNRSSYSPLFAAIAYYKDPEDEYVTIMGWYKLDKRECRTFHARFGRYEKIKFGYYAEWERGRRVWPPSGEWKLCLEKVKAFERYNSSGYTCKSKEKLVDFDTITVEQDQPSRTVNLR